MKTRDEIDETINLLPLTSIHIPDRLRKDYGIEEMDELCDSMTTYGLIQPIVINQDNVLIAGGRRLAAATRLKWDLIPITFRETQSESERQAMELEENMQRKNMTWQEEVCSVAEIHQLKQLSLDQEWGSKKTGVMLGMSVGKVQYSLRLASLIKANDSEVIACDGPTSALKLLWKREEEATLRELALRTYDEPVQTETAGHEAAMYLDGIGNKMTTRELLYPEQLLPLETKYKPILGKGFDEILDTTFGVDVNGIGAVLEKAVAKLLGTTTVPLSKMLLRQPTLSLSVLQSLPTASVDHCITDPPYGIDLDNISQSVGTKTVECLKISHLVEENLKMLPLFLQETFRITKEHGFCAFWCDIMNWRYLYDCAIDIGWRVQRWPVVWEKTHVCLNHMPQYNFTKSIELVMVCRKPNALLVVPSPTCVVQASVGPAKQEYGDHPFVKPRECWDFLIEHITMQGQTILEPFAGRGSGVLPALRSGRKVIAIEYDETHYAYLVENVKKHYLSVNPNTKFI